MLYSMTGMKAGYISIIYNIMIMGIEMIILHRHFHKSLLLQLVPGMISGLILNYFVYDLPLTAQLSISSYALSIIVFLIGLITNACGNHWFSDGIFMSAAGTENNTFFSVLQDTVRCRLCCCCHEEYDWNDESLDGNILCSFTAVIVAAFFLCYMIICDIFVLFYCFFEF